MSGAMVKNLRQQMEMTQEEFAREMNVTFSTVNRWENGHAKPSRLAMLTIQRIASERQISLQ
jgi:DNA-binding transcriptional regulator YiaG